MSPWIHGGDPVEIMRINQHVEKFKVCALYIILAHYFLSRCAFCFILGELENRELLTGENKAVLPGQSTPTYFGYDSKGQHLLSPNCQLFSIFLVH